jgi:mono/diheme cytochrome c family protein
VDDPRFKDTPQPLRTHPKIGPHPFEKFGCTTCHGGVGRATDARSAHEGLVVTEGRLLPTGEIRYEEERFNPLWRKEFVQASCGSCHMRQRFKEARLVTLGKSLFREKGCMGCHKIGGIGGKIGPDLTFVGERRSDPQWYMAHFKSPEEVSPGSAMPSYKDLSLLWQKALAVFMLSLRRIPSSLLPGIPLEEKEVHALVEPPVDRGHWEAPESAEALKNPLPPTTALLAEAGKLYASRCASCHGETGKGDGKGAPDLKPRPSNFTMGHTAEHPEGALFWKIKQGRGLMPGWGGTLPDRQIWLLVSYIRQFGHQGMMPGMRHDTEPGKREDGHTSERH